MVQQMWSPLIGAVVVLLAVAAPVSGDEVLFLNGDRLTGTIVGAAGGKLTIKTDTAGEVTVDLAKVRTFTTDSPILIRMGDRTSISSTAAPGADGTIQVVPVPGGVAQTVALRDVTAINPAPVRWTGAVSASGILTTGNTETLNIGINANAVRRSEQDRISLGAGYLYGRQRSPSTDRDETTVDNVTGGLAVAGAGLGAASSATRPRRKGSGSHSFLSLRGCRLRCPERGRDGSGDSARCGQPAATHEEPDQSAVSHQDKQQGERFPRGQCVQFVHTALPGR